MGTAYLGANVFMSRQSLPIRDAEIIVSEFRNGIKTEIQRLITDVDGNTPVIEVSAPDKSLSLDENNPIQPYSTYTMEMMAPGFVTKVVENIQAFDTITTIVPIEVLPVPRSGEIPKEDAIVDIPPHNLFIPGCRDHVVGPIIQPYVLKEVVIPEFIIVHLGTPSNKNAKNVWVTLPDYIKNVASSEIYPTWPTNSLIANIHCQISFVLNRVFTEWYMSRGYNFHITNSTQYDQKYIHGRNIFDSISKIVDDIFNMYLRKPSTYEPFFAEYCDGKQTTCKGLKQWGTVTLANQGYTPKRIIEYYYGPMEIIPADTIKGIPSSYPGTPLRIGSTGEAVKTLQRQLNRIAKNYPNIKPVPVNGVFNEATANAVKAFQKSFKLTQDGIVGKATWYKVSYIYVAVKKLAELDSEGERPDVKPGGYPGYIIKQGQSGNNVKSVQYILSLLSTFYNEINPLNVDGIFGPATTEAVKTFQKIYSLSADGLVGPSTWAKLIDIYKAMREDINFPNDVYPGSPLRVGSRGASVEKIQVYLDAINDSYPSIPGLATDGIFGQGTKRSVEAFQRLFGLGVDGIVGKLTWDSIVDVYYSVLNKDFFSGRNLQRGSSGNEVRKIQTMIRELSKVISELESIEADGLFGAKTEKNVKAFQRLYGLDDDGIIGQNTWDAIVNTYNRYYYKDNYEPLKSLSRNIHNNIYQNNIENNNDTDKNQNYNPLETSYEPNIQKSYISQNNYEGDINNNQRGTYNPLSTSYSSIDNNTNNNQRNSYDPLNTNYSSIENEMKKRNTYPYLEQEQDKMENILNQRPQQQKNCNCNKKQNKDYSNY